MKSQRGFTLIEILVATAILGTILTVLIASYTNIVGSTMRNTSSLEVLTDISHAALVIQKDLFMVQATDLDGGSRPLSDGTVELSWYDYVASWGGDSDGTHHISTYSLVGTELRRSHDIEGVVVQTIVGRNIASVTFTEAGRVVRVEISAVSANPPYQSETFDISSYKRTLGVQ